MIRRIQQAAVIGSGVMGSGIAALLVLDPINGRKIKGKSNINGILDNAMSFIGCGI